MKKAVICITMLAGFSMPLRSAAQGQPIQQPNQNTLKFSIYIKGSAAQQPTIITNSNGTKHVVFPNNTALNNVLSQYTIKKFEMLLPAARRPYLHQYWVIEAVNGADLMNAMLNYANSICKDAHVIGTAHLTYTPNDFALQSIWGHQDDLDAINAREAWDITHGNPDVIVGITDTHFEVSHPDLVGKIVNVRSNSTAPTWNHGTNVAGGVAAGTDNNKGISSIGFNTRLDVSDIWANDNEMLQMSKDGRKILNASWYQDCQSDFTSINDYIGRVMAYDNIYENGAIPFFGAGNGPGDCNYLETFPSAFQHNIAVSAVGYDKTAGATENIFDVHDRNPNILSQTANHNASIDIVAPGYNRMIIGVSQSGQPDYGRIDGTSHAAPLVAGTAALMQAVCDPNGSQCLSPYQMEYWLKYSADASLYNNPLNAAYVGQLGAGRLDAYQAVLYTQKTNNWDPCNDPTTQTLLIRGIELNTVCAPGHASNNVLPQFTTVVNNAGVYPLTYKWVPLNENTTTLNAYDIAAPTVISATGTNPVAHYYLMVSDASGVAQKVASKEIKVTLKTSGSYDLAMRDGYMDMLNEPNTMRAIDERDAIWWDGHDIWNRRVDDGLTDHQDPEYFVNNPNFLYTRVRNIGCAASPATGMKLRLYWTLQSTGEDWESDWKTTNFVNPVTQQVLPAGRELTIAPYGNGPIDILSLQPGESRILKHEWHPGNPTDYDPNITQLNACVLARIEQSSQSPYGMAFSEQIGPVGPNVTNNNNIITRNMNFVNLEPGDIVPQYLAIIGNPLQVQSAFTLRFLNDRSIRRELSGNFSAVAYVRLHLGATLYSRWVRGGQKGNFAATDSKNYTVDFDGSTTMDLNNIVLEAGERLPYRIEFILRDDALLNDMNYLLHLNQVFENNTVGEPITLEDNVIGGISFQVHTQPEKAIVRKNVIPTLGDELYQIYPNPAYDKVYITYKGKDKEVAISAVDITGRTIIMDRKMTVGFSAQTVDLGSIKAGVYIITITDLQGNTSKFKVVKQ